MTEFSAENRWVVWHGNKADSVHSSSSQWDAIIEEMSAECTLTTTHSLCHHTSELSTILLRAECLDALVLLQ